MITETLKNQLINIVGSLYVFTDEETLNDYGKDHTEDFVFPPGIVVKPASTEEVSEIMKQAFEYEIPVVPIGARTGLSGGVLCVHKGIGLSMERLNQIEKIDEQNLQVITQPGVITEVLQNAVAEKGLFYPVDPSSKGSCFIGGNVSENAGGARAVKYGVTKDYVLNLEVVLPNGEIIWTGANTLKNATGYNLTQLIVGSEGTLGVVTKIVLKLITHPTKDMLMFIPFEKMNDAISAVPEIMRKGITPSGLEFMEKDAVLWTLNKFPEIQMPIDESHEAYLLVEVDGFDDELLMKEMEEILQVVEQFPTGEILFADSQAEKDKLWEIRRKISEAVKRNSVYKEEDTVVPRYELPKLLAGVKRIGNEYGFKSVCYGHVGDGNLHVNIIKGELSEEEWNNELPKAIREIFQLCVSLGGTISGEHGIGWVQKEYMDIAFGQTSLNLMKEIKKVFDPKGILNPGKIL